MTIHITDCADGCILSVRAQPGARRNAIVGAHGGALKIAITAPPDKGRANDALIDVLAEAFSLKRASIELVAGMTSRQKKFRLGGISAQALNEVLARLLDGQA